MAVISFAFATGPLAAELGRGGDIPVPGRSKRHTREVFACSCAASGHVHDPGTKSPLR